jgi:hypothetical protein
MRPLISMRRALEDPDIFGATDPSWLPWNVLLIAGMGEPLRDGEERAMFRKLTGREREPLERVEELVAVCGRRSGKTTAAARLLVYLSALCTYDDCLDFGERGLGLFLATTAHQAKIAFDRAAGIVDASALLRSMVITKTQDTIALSNSVDLVVRPASPRGLRGVTAVGVCCDEAAHFLTEGQNSDTEVLNAVRPSLATTGGIMLVASSPYWEQGELFELHRRHYSSNGDRKILVAQAASRVTNPLLPESVVLRALERDEASARAEYLAEFRSDISAFIERELIEAAVDKGVLSRPPLQGQNHVCFADSASGISASGTGDTFSMAIGHRENEQIIIDLLYAKKPPFNASDVVAEICHIARGYGVHEIVSDRYSVGFMHAEVSRHGMMHRASDYDKSQLYLNSLPAFSSRVVRLTDNRTVVEQFCMLERRPGAGARDRVDARGGKSEDSANCVAGVISLLAKPLTGAEAWIEHYRRMNVADGLSFDRAGVDMDAVRTPGPEFGWNMTSAPLVRVVVPPVIAAEGAVNGRSLRRIEGKAIAELTRGEACGWLQNPEWRRLNQELAEELLGEPAS